MALTLPPEFANDTKSKDTRLIPLIDIGGTHYISTNNLVFHDKRYLPLLDNVPSLKESIDIQTRKYKISNVTLNIHNAPYNGEKFSDKDIKLNDSVEIRWMSPTCSLPEHCLLVYRGFVRDYRFNNEKVIISVEDKSQQIVHVNLPKEKLNNTDEVPEKYRNKPIPMVYGKVDKSPCVLDANKVLKADSTLSVEGFVFDEPHDLYSDQLSPLFIESDGKYIPIPFYIEEDLGSAQGLPPDDEFPESIVNSLQWSYDGSKITFASNILSSNDIVQGLLMHKASSIDYRSVDDSFVDNLLGEDVVAAFSDGDDSSANFLNTPSYTRHYQPQISNIVKTLSKLTIYTSPSIDNMLNYHNKDIFFNGVKLPIPKRISPQSFNDRVYYYSNVVGEFYGDGTFFKIDGTSDTFISPEPFDLTELFGFPQDPGNTDPTNNEWNIYNPTGDILIKKVIEYGENTSNNSQGASSIGLFFFDWAGIGSSVDNGQYMIYFRIYDNFTNLAEPGNTGTVTHALDIDANIKEIDIKSIVDIEKAFTKNFYVNIKGRRNPAGTFVESFPDIIKDIYISELGQPSEDFEDTTDSAYSPWTYAFTVNKNIDSKKLFEEIGSASPFIPRFNNQGDFILDTIKTTYQLSDYEDNNPLLIKNNDVIDFSYSLTPIEDVYTKVIFHYNYNYGLDKFDNTTESYVRAFFDIEDYSYSKYAFDDTGEVEMQEGHISNTTLVIDDHRGKYIRNHGTAKAFCEWILLWHCNQHLKIKITLPLKYLHLEIGNIIQTDEILGGITPYGIDYSAHRNINGQDRYKAFMITSTNKQLDKVTIECIQMHNLTGIPITGCMQSSSCNYNPFATIPDNQSCWTPNPGCTCSEAEGSTLDDCGVCGGGNADMDNCGECFGSNLGCDDCNGVPGGNAVEDYCGVCGSWDDPTTSTFLDECGVCHGDGECECSDGTFSCNCCCPGYLYTGEVMDCLGECGGEAQDDDCGVCAGSNFFVIEGTNTPCNQGEANCVNQASGSCDCGDSTWDCSGQCGSGAYIDNCGECVGGGTGLSPCEPDCSEYEYQCDGVWDGSACWGGSAVRDVCENCTAPQGQEPLDGQLGYCNGEIGGDYCTGECGCYDMVYAQCDCDGNFDDGCGVCGGNSDTCVHCANVTAINYDSNAINEDACLYIYDDLLACHNSVIDGYLASNYICNILPSRCEGDEFTSGERGIWEVSETSNGNYGMILEEVRSYCSYNPEQCTQEAYDAFKADNSSNFYPIVITSADCDVGGLSMFNVTGVNLQAGTMLTLGEVPPGTSGYAISHNWGTNIYLYQNQGTWEGATAEYVALDSGKIRLELVFGNVPQPDVNDLYNANIELDLKVEIINEVLGGWDIIYNYNNIVGYNNGTNRSVYFDLIDPSTGQWALSNGDFLNLTTTGSPNTYRYTASLRVNESLVFNASADHVLEYSVIDADDCPKAIGDINGDEGWNVLDIVTLATCILNNNCSSLPYGCAGDLNGDGIYNVLDIVVLANCILGQNCGEL